MKKIETKPHTQIFCKHDLLGDDLVVISFQHIQIYSLTIRMFNHHKLLNCNKWEKICCHKLIYYCIYLTSMDEIWIN